MTPTQRTLAKLRKDGYTAAVVEHWNPHARIRQDLFGIIDIIALRDGETLGVQATSYPNVSARLKKSRSALPLKAWLAAGNKYEVWGWRKGVRGEKALRIVPVTAAERG